MKIVCLLLNLNLWLMLKEEVLGIKHLWILNKSVEKGTEIFIFSNISRKSGKLDIQREDWWSFMHIPQPICTTNHSSTDRRSLKASGYGGKTMQLLIEVCSRERHLPAVKWQSCVCVLGLESVKVEGRKIGFWFEKNYLIQNTV